MLNLPIYFLGSSYYLHTRIHGKQVKRSLRTSYQRVAIIRAITLLNGLTMQEPTGDFPTKYELDISKGIAKSDGPEDHARLMQAIEALKTMQSGLPLAAGAMAPAPAATGPAQPPDDPTALKLDELVEKFCLLRKVKQGTVRTYSGAAEELAAFLGNPRITRITPSAITRFQEHLATKGNSIRTIDNKTGAIRALLGFANKQGYMRDDNPAAGRGLMSKKQKAQGGWATFEQDEIEALLTSTFFRERLNDDADYATAYGVPGGRNHIARKRAF